METPNVLKGYLYPSSRVCRCPRFHACIATKKCQNYDPHQLDCSVCEQRTTLNDNLGGFLPEGEYVPDLQDAIHTLEEQLNKPMAHPDQQGQKGEDITNKYNKERKAADMLAHFMNDGTITMEEKIMYAMSDPETAKLLGRME